MNESLPQVYLVRHGETAWSLSGQHTGRSDIPLTARGEEMARALPAQLAGKSFALVLSSPLTRARHTAELAGFSKSVELSDDLLEWNYGAYEGKKTVEIRAEHPKWNAFSDGAPGGETIYDVATRAERVIGRLRAMESGNALLFAHRDILRVLIARWLALPAKTGRRFNLEPASISVLGYDHTLDEPLLHSLNH